MTVVSLSWETAHLHGETWISHHRLRHRLFVERQGWEIPTYRGMEYDEFDTPAAQYLLWVDDIITSSHRQSEISLCGEHSYRLGTV